MHYAYASTTDAPHQGQVAEINIIPLADVMLVLLVIFMIASPALSYPIPLQLQQAGSPDTPVVASEPIRLAIAADGQLAWNGNAISAWALPGMLERESARDPADRPSLALSVDPDSDYQAVATVLAAAQNADITRIGFVQP